MDKTQEEVDKDKKVTEEVEEKQDIPTKDVKLDTLDVKKIYEDRNKDFFKLCEEMKIDEKINQAPKKSVPQTSYGGRIRISSLVENDATKWIDKVITVAGWARTIKEQGKGSFAFIKLNDGSTIKNLQIVVDKDMPGFEHLTKQGIGTSLSLKGLIVKSQGKEQLIEMTLKDPNLHSLKVLGECNPSEYSLTKGKDNQMKLESLRGIAHLRPRTNIISCVARVRNNLAYATHTFFQQKGFYYVHTPLITGADCEGAGEMFQVTTLLPKSGQISKVPLTKEGFVDYKQDFFGKDTYLTVSGQLAVENYSCALSDVYTFGPTFRAEVSHTTRHLAEFWMIEPEMSFADIYDDMDCAESYLKFCVRYVLENNMDDLEFLEKNQEKDETDKKEKGEKKLIERLKNIVESDFARISYTEAISLLEQVYLLFNILESQKEKRLL